MRISTKLRIGYIFSAIVVILAGTIIIVSFKQQHNAVRELRFVDTITQRVFELNLAGHEFLLHQEKRPKAQWEITYQTLIRLLDQKNSLSNNHQSVLIKLREDLALAQILFADFASRQTSSSAFSEGDLSRKFQNRLQNQLILKSQRMLSHATQLKHQIEDELLTIQRYINWIIITLILASALLFIIIGYLISRSIIVPVKALLRGTEIIGSGDLEFRLKTDRRDEIGQLSESFDRMINDLNTVMVSRDGLEDRIAERTAELTASNRRLSLEIEERKQAQEKLKAAELRYQTVADYTYDWEHWANLDGSMEYVSPSCERVSGYTTKNFIERPSLFREIIVPEDREIWDKHYHNSRQEFKAHEIQFQIQRKDGQFRWIEHACQPVYDIEGDAIGIRASNRDITARKQAEFELQRAYTKILSLKERLEAESTYLQEEIKLEHNFENIIGQSEELKYVLFQVEQVASADSSVLILGETGTGKELVARAIHKLSPRGSRVLVKVNCAALPAELIESELFGREKGAFTGATNTQIGRFELAKGSTIFLDEIGELPLTLQAKLLRIYESGEFERLGSPKTRHSDARIIAATNRNLEGEARQGRFREDLWYRLKVFTVTLPPLRQRRADIPLLIKWFMDQISRKMGKTAIELPKHTIQALQDYHWPGNVRELRNMVESALITGRFDKLILESPRTADNRISDFQSLEDMERDYILQVLREMNWKIQGANSAASVLEMNPNTLRARIKKLGIKKPSE